jgi:hypothetical protein
MRRARDELMIISPMRTLGLLPKSTTTKPWLRCSSVINKCNELRFVFLLDGGLGCNTTFRLAKVVVGTSTYTLNFFSFPLPALTLAFSSNFSFLSSSFRHVFFNDPFTLFDFFLSSTYILTMAFFLKCFCLNQ